MRKQFITFEEEEENTQHFLEKLNKFKKASKNLKQKTKQQTHKMDWQKQYQKLEKQEKELTREVEKDLLNIDQQYNQQLQDNKIFEKEKYASYYDFFTKQNEQFEIFDLNIWYQVQNFRNIAKDIQNLNQKPVKNELNSQNKTKFPPIKKPSLKEKVKIAPKKQQNLEEIAQMMDLKTEIKDFLVKMKSISDDEYNLMGLNKSKFTSQKNEIPSELQNDANELKKFVIYEEENEEDDEEEQQGDSLQIQQEDQNIMDDNVKEKQKQIQEQMESLNETDFSGIIGYIKVIQDENLGVEGEEQQILEQYLKALRFLKERYKLEIEKINLDYEDGKINFDEVQFIQEGQNFEHFYYIYKTYYKNGKERERYMQRLNMHFPSVKRIELEVVDQFIQSEEFKAQRLNSLYRNYAKERNQLKKTVEEQIMSLINMRINENMKQNQIIKNQQEHERLQEELEAKKKLFEIKKEKVRNEKEMQKEIQKIEEERKDQQWNIHAKQQKKKSIAYTQEQSLKKQLEKEEQAKLSALKQQQVKNEIMKNAIHVQNRQIHSYQKIQQNIERAEYKQNFKEYNDQRIQQAVSKYGFRPQVESDPSRLIAETENLRNKKMTKMDMADKVDMEKRQGFTVNQLMSDMRYRLGAALQDAGLSQAQYSQQVMSSLAQAQPRQNHIF